MSRVACPPASFAVPPALCTLTPAPCTLKPTPYGLKPTPYGLKPAQSGLKPTQSGLTPPQFALPPPPFALRYRRAARGFSLIELLVVLAIMAVLASIGMPLAELSHQRNKEEELRRSLREIRTALDAYKRLVDQGSIQRAADASGYPPSLEALVEGVADARSPKGTKIYLLRNLPRDPLATDAGQSAAQTWSVRSYASPATDPQAGADVFDVHSRAQGTGLNGVPYREW